MSGLLNWIVATTIIVGLGLGVGVWVWYQSRPKKIIYTARVYQTTESIREIDITGNDERYGKNRKILKLTDLKPYVVDTLEVIMAKDGSKVFKLRRLDITTGEVLAKHIEHFGDKRYVDILYHKSSATPMEKGYDEVTGKTLFYPMPREDMDMVAKEMMIRKARNRNEKKNLLAELFQYAVMAMAFITLIAFASIMGNSWVEAAQIQQQTTDDFIAHSQAIHDQQMQMFDATNKVAENKVGQKAAVITAPTVPE